jgi:hypothetical protein
MKKLCLVFVLAIILFGNVFGQDEKWDLTGTLIPVSGWTGRYVIGGFIVDVFTSSIDDKEQSESAFGISEYFAGSKSVRIPSSINGTTVAIICKGAFKDKGLTSVTFPPDSIFRIDEEAFMGNSLTTISIDAAGTWLRIGANAFKDNKLSSVTITGALGVTIGDYALANNQIKTVDLPVFVRIGKYAFQKNQLTDISFLDFTIEAIPEGAFSDNKFTEFKLPWGVKVIEARAFANNQINSIDLKDISDNLTTIGVDAFANNKITSLTIPGSVTALGGFAGNKIAKIEIPGTVTTISTRAFFNNQLATVHIPDTVSKIGADAFKGNKFYCFTEGVEFNEQDSTATIIEYSGNKTDLIIPRTITKPCAKKEYGITSVSSVLLAKPPSSITIEADIDIENMNIGHRFPVDYEAYNKQPGKYISSVYEDMCDWALESAQRTEGEFIVAEMANSLAIIKYAGKETEVSIPNKIGNLKVTRINVSAFSGKRLTKIIIPSSIEYIGAGAFSKNHLTQIIIPSSVVYIGPGAFSGNGIEKIIFPWGLDDRGGLPRGFIDAYERSFKTGGTYRINQHADKSKYSYDDEEWIGGWFGWPKFKSNVDFFMGVGHENGIDTFALGPINTISILDVNIKLGMEIILFTFDTHLYAYGGLGSGLPHPASYFFGGTSEIYLLSRMGIGGGIGMKGDIPFDDSVELKKLFPNRSLQTYYHGEIFLRSREKIGIYGKLGIYGNFYPNSKSWEAGLVFGTW